MEKDWRFWYQEVSKDLGLAHVDGATYFSFSIIMIFLFYMGLVFLNKYQITLNLSESLPEYVYIVKKNEPFSRNDKVKIVYHEHKHLVYNPGTEMVKIVAGIPGDKVEFKGHKFYINGKFFGEYKDYSLNGVPLEPNHTHILGPNKYFLFAPHPDSFDSRYVYMGDVDKRDIVGKVVAEL